MGIRGLVSTLKCVLILKHSNKAVCRMSSVPALGKSIHPPGLHRQAPGSLRIASRHTDRQCAFSVRRRETQAQGVCQHLPPNWVLCLVAFGSSSPVQELHDCPPKRDTHTPRPFPVKPVRCASASKPSVALRGPQVPPGPGLGTALGRVSPVREEVEGTAPGRPLVAAECKAWCPQGPQPGGGDSSPGTPACGGDRTSRPRFLFYKKEAQWR